jgi:hypothetical protein
MGKNFMLESGRVKIWLAGQGSTFPVGVAKRRTTIGELHLPQVHKASQAISQMPTRPSSFASLCTIGNKEN